MRRTLANGAGAAQSHYRRGISRIAPTFVIGPQIWSKSKGGQGMSTKSQKLPVARRGSLKENASSVESLFGRRKQPSATARATAITSLDELQGDQCAWCAKPFEPTWITQIFCGEKCRRASSREETEGWRARVREILKCQTCGAQIVGAVRRDTKFCPDCREKAIKLCKQNSEARAKAGKTGQRGSNQWGRKEREG